MNTREIIDKLRLAWREHMRHSRGPMQPALIVTGRGVYTMLRCAATPWNVYALTVVHGNDDYYLTFQGVRVVLAPELADDYVEVFSALPTGK